MEEKRTVKACPSCRGTDIVFNKGLGGIPSNRSKRNYTLKGYYCRSCEQRFQIPIKVERNHKVSPLPPIFKTIMESKGIEVKVNGAIA